jgi:hypothetical protein
VKWLGALAILGYIASPAVAQPSKPGSVTVKLEGTCQQQLQELEAIISYLESLASQVGQKLSQARQQKDVVKTICLNDKKSQIDAILNAARGRMRSAVQAAGRKDQDSCNQEIQLSKMHQQRGQQLAAESGQCIGEDTSALGDGTTTLVLVDSDIPPDEGPGWFPPVIPGVTITPTGPGTIIIAPPGSATTTK